VLVVGDSVSIGYTPFVAELLASKALVQHSPWGGDGGAEETKYGASCIEYLLRAPGGAALAPDVLMFNWGLHNSLAGNCTAPCDPGQSGPPAEYAPYLKQIVARLKALAANGKTKLLFAITSPDLCNKPIDDIQVQLNSQAVAIMKDAGIPTVDLYHAITGKCGPVPTASCFGQKGCYCPHCPPGYSWLATSTIVPAISALL
jgi:acyl-CoA thioesterase-1